MRSRYTAYTLGDAGHLRRSWHPDTCPPEITVDHSIRWQGLEILETQRGRALDATGDVVFAAHYDAGAGPSVMRERSRFGRLGGAWVYLDGDPLV